MVNDATRTYGEGEERGRCIGTYGEEEILTLKRRGEGGKNGIKYGEEEGRERNGEVYYFLD